MKILPETFQFERTLPGLKWHGGVNEVGAVSVELDNGEVIRCKAMRESKQDPRFRGLNISVAGFVGKYKTSKKIWLAHVDLITDYKGELSYREVFGQDNAKGSRAQKLPIFYDEKLYKENCPPLHWINQ
jgi:hypothetical protein